MRRVLLVASLACMACTDDGPHDVAASNAGAHGVEVKTRRSTVKGKKLAWGGLVTNAGDRFVRGANVVVVARGKGGSEVGRGKGHVDLLPPHYGVRLEVNGIEVSSAPKHVDVAIEGVDVAPPEEQPIKWQSAGVGWEKGLPDGLAFAVEEDDKCGGQLGKKGEPATFRCVLGVKHTGTRAARDVRLKFKPARGGDPIEVKPPLPTDLAVEPGDALVFFVDAKMTTPSETILGGSAEAR